MIIQFTGLSGAGKTTLANKIKNLLEVQQISTAVVDGDVYRKTICADLGFSKADREENIRRLGAAAASLEASHQVVIIAAINPFETVRAELANKYNARVVWIRCDLTVLTERDTKGLYRKALLPDDHPEKIKNLTGVNDVYEIPETAEIIIDTALESAAESAEKLQSFILRLLK